MGISQFIDITPQIQLIFIFMKWNSSDHELFDARSFNILSSVIERK